MTITVQSDGIEGQSLSFTGEGPMAIRTFFASTTAGESMFDVLLDPAIPGYWDAYPDTPTSYIPSQVTNINCTPLGSQNNRFKITVSYSTPDIIQKEPGDTSADSLIQLGSSVSASRTQKDNTGTQLSISLTGQTAQVGDVEIQIPQTVLLFERKEGSSPAANAKANVGYVNDTALGTGAYAVRTLLCLGIDGTSTDNGSTWQVSYRFQYRAETWDAELVYIDPETDRPHADVNLATMDGYTIAEVYPEVDFGNLDLDF